MTATIDPDERSRLIAAFSKALGEQGYSHLEIETVARYAGVSVDRFHEHFSGPDKALVAAQEVFFQRLWLDVESACESRASWPERICAAVAAVIASLVETSAIARVFAIEAPGASFAAAERQFAALTRLSGYLREGRRLYPHAARLPDSTERALLGGLVSIICEHLLAEDPQAIPRLQPQLIEVLLSPYLGEEEARRIATS